MPRGRPDHSAVGEPWIETEENGDVYWCWVLIKDLWGAMFVNIVHRTLIGRRCA
jgi:hypothetical protein